ncbi:hypothetical protein BOC37_19630 [Burkholderia pseudomallei]|nr:hypothetical protein BOC37_19630 [Burkholderia pseudomallei]
MARMVELVDFPAIAATVHAGLPPGPDVAGAGADSPPISALIVLDEECERQLLDLHSCFA